MTKIRCCLSVVLLTTLCAQEFLTNALVIKMVKAGLSEEAIVSTVRTQPAKFDLSADQLIALKAAGVTDKEIAAMIQRSAVEPAAPPAPAPATVDGSGPLISTPPAEPKYEESAGDLLGPRDSGIYLVGKGPDGAQTLTALGPAVAQMQRPGLKDILRKKKLVIAGQHASLVTSNTNPLFYVYCDESGRKAIMGFSIANPNQFAIVRVDAHNTVRELELNQWGSPAATAGNVQKVIVFKADKVRQGLYKVTPILPLQPGEYCFVSAQINVSEIASGSAAAAPRVLDFAVSAN